MTCRDVTAFLADYVSGALAPEVLSTFETHMAICANCRAFIAQYRLTLAAHQRAADPLTDIPDDLVRAIVASVRKP